MYLKNPLPLVLCAILVAIATSLCSAQQPAQKPDEPKIIDVRFVTFHQPTPDDKVSFRLAIDGENLPKPTTAAGVRFTTKDPALPVDVICLVDANKTEILVDATAKVGTEITRITVAEGNTTVDTSPGFTISIKANPPAPKLKQFEVKLEHEKNKEFPNLHSLVVTKESGDADVGFADRPHLMTVDLMPGGATDVNIVQSNLQRLDLHFVAAADYVPTNVVVTVYSSSDLDTRQAVAVAVNKKTPEDPDAPKITSAETVFINRSHGVGRIRILGTGFGDYPAPPYQVDDYLWNCLEEFHIRGTNRYAPRVQQLEFNDIEQRIEACRRMLGGDIDAMIAAEETAGENTLKGMGEEDIKPEEEPALKKRIEATKTNFASFVTHVQKEKDPEEWAEEIRRKAMVTIHSRNPDIEVERVEILDISDKMIDVYFEFTRYRGYSYPLRLEDSTVTIKKTVQKTTQTVKNDKVTGTVTGPKDETYNLAYQIGPKRDPNLTYNYTILDNHSANTLLGKGVADNFYVLQLSVVNNSEKKVAIPLASIHAEVEWIRGLGGPKNKNVAFVQGPPTLAPIPLAAVSSNFEAYQKAIGLRARLFNGLDAATIVGTALVPFTGPSLKSAEVFFSGGFVPAVHKAWGDLSSQQLQNLTSLSWESSETLPAKGGSVEKLIYIQKRSQQFESKPVKAIAVAPVTTSQIASILGLEVTGFEVVESEAKQATQTPATPPTAGTTPSSSQASPQPAGPSTPATPTEPGTKPKGKEKP
jgi:hypothetical protein